ncbi:methyltransferase MtfB [Nocardioides baekrokdamisoli]|uniref:Methyltransferase MtfB n=1 Tax=Nocardioides baekrokdamisoli TaxID=1804624 RepID=A0A3G9J0C4_9ACTN|nr:TylF/MycF/NovP-related O-methyltransferase [Nocardioides baekrokdamisoli]BBH17088.1 methyltransferase MtfB [Nocardioides baekrokdamisoli]
MNPAADSYLTLLAETLTRYQRGQHLRAVDPLGRGRVVTGAVRTASGLLARQGLVVARPVPSDDAAREIGKEWPYDGAETMIGLKRLANIRQCIETALADGVPGDVMECGVWRGGAAIYMAATLAVHDATDRAVWLADSFEGLPAPETQRYAKADQLDLSDIAHLAVGLEEVQANLRKYHLLGDNIRFLQGWFKDTLPTAPVESLAVLRLDGDLYSSTMDVLVSMYDKVSVGGFILVDDYNDLAECREAVTDFRAERGITDEIVPVDWTGVYWRKS